MTDDHLPLTPEELKAALRAIKQEFHSVDAKWRSSHEGMERYIAAIHREAKLSRRLADLKLPLDQEQLLFSLLTLPPEGIDLLRELLKQEH
jgi:hypothetical protein